MAERPEVDKEWSVKQRKLFKHKKNHRVEEIRAERKARNLAMWENIKPRIEAANLQGGQTFFLAQHLPIGVIVLAAMHGVEIEEEVRPHYYSFSFTTPERPNRA